LEVEGAGVKSAGFEDNGRFDFLPTKESVI